MKRVILALFTLAVSVATPAFATEPLQVVLSNSPDPADAGTGKIVVTLTNTGTVPITLHHFMAPFNWESNLPHDMFVVVGPPPNNQVEQYTGETADPVANAPGLFSDLGPGQSLSEKIDLRKNYNFAEGWGNYKITYTQVLGQLPDPPLDPNNPTDSPLPPVDPTDPNRDREVVSNTLTIAYNPTAASAAAPKLAPSITAGSNVRPLVWAEINDPTGACTADGRIDTISTALHNAHTVAIMAYSYAQAMFTYRQDDHQYLTHRSQPPLIGADGSARGRVRTFVLATPAEISIATPVPFFSENTTLNDPQNASTRCYHDVRGQTPTYKTQFAGGSPLFGVPHDRPAQEFLHRLSSTTASISGGKIHSKCAHTNGKSLRRWPFADRPASSYAV